MVQQFTVVFLVVLIGYFLLSRSNYYRERLIAGSNYALLYESAIAGGTLFGLMWVVLFLLKIYGFDCANFANVHSEVCLVDRIYPVPFLDVLVGSALIAFLLIVCGNRLLTDDERRNRIARKSSLIASTVLDSQEGSYLGQVTTMRGKVYVGWITLGPGLSKEGKPQDIAVVPLYSGHRNPSTQEMILDIDYSSALAIRSQSVESMATTMEDTRENPPKEMSVVIPVEEIALIRRHDLELAESFLKTNVSVNPLALTTQLS